MKQFIEITSDRKSVLLNLASILVVALDKSLDRKLYIYVLAEGSRTEVFEYSSSEEAQKQFAALKHILIAPPVK